MSEVISPKEIKSMRRSVRMTQEEFAHELGVTFTTVNRWENGKAIPSRLAIRALERYRRRTEAFPPVQEREFPSRIREAQRVF